MYKNVRVHTNYMDIIIFFTLMEQLMRDDSLMLRVMRSKSEMSDFFKS